MVIIFRLFVMGRYDQWNEPQKLRKLHFNNEVKALVAGNLVRLFENLKDK
jgi:hypothetical protein